MSECTIISKFDELAAAIYREKEEFNMSYSEIAKARNIKSSYVKLKYSTAKIILRHHEQLWTLGLSMRARHALLQAGFTSKQELYEIISKGIVDLAELPNIGNKTRSEIRKWLFD